MKLRKNVLFALAAGIAVAGLAAFLFGTEQGRNTTRNLRKKGEYMVDEMEDLVDDVREKFNGWQKKMAKCQPKAENAMAEQEM